MKTKSCRECHEPMQVNARKCPHCGTTQNLSARVGWVVVLAIVILIASVYQNL